jgi:hypothetical protein
MDYLNALSRLESASHSPSTHLSRSVTISDRYFFDEHIRACFGVIVFFSKLQYYKLTVLKASDKQHHGLENKGMCGVSRISERLQI